MVFAACDQCCEAGLGVFLLFYYTVWMGKSVVAWGRFRYPRPWGSCEQRDRATGTTPIVRKDHHFVVQRLACHHFVVLILHVTTLQY